MYRVQYSTKSIEDLTRLKSYITIEFDEMIATEIITKVMAKIRKLEAFPIMGMTLANLIV